MIYAHFIEYPRFKELVHLLQSQFAQVQWGSQCDDWIWITHGTMKVAIDNFWSQSLQIKAAPASKPLLDRVIQAIDEHYRLAIIDPPELEPHESPS